MIKVKNNPVKFKKCDTVRIATTTKEALINMGTLHKSWLDWAQVVMGVIMKTSFGEKQYYVLWNKKPPGTYGKQLEWWSGDHLELVEK